MRATSLACAYIFSGGTRLLTDPQIITAQYVSKPDSSIDSNPNYYRDTGIIFSEGNLASTHATFSTEHVCNMFCKFFNLPALAMQTTGEALLTNNPHSIMLSEEGEITEIFD